MAFVGQATAAAILVALTLLFQSAGMAALIHWLELTLSKVFTDSAPSAPAFSWCDSRV